MGLIRRGTTPTAPKPINLPSQKLENQGLVPDVDIVPRGTFCWGRAGSSVAANGKNDERTDSAPLHLESNGTVDNDTIVQNDLVSLRDLAEWSNPPHPVESSTSPTPSLVCVPPIETTSASSIFGANDAKLDSRSPASSDAGSLPGSVAPASSSESGTSPLATPVTFNKTWDSAAKVEERKQNKAFPVVCCEGSEKVPNLDSKQGTHGGNESLPGSQDFGYFEGFYSNHHNFFSPGMLYSNGPGMAFGPGLHPDPSQHDGFYSFLGVPYYDSSKDKEIVVITMVGNPGFHGNYFPHPGFPDQYGRPTVCENFPLQFGHFEHFAVPGQNILDGRHHMSAETNPMGFGEQGEFVCYEQGYHKEGWFNGSSIDNVQRGSVAYLPTSFSMCKSSPNVQDYNVPKRAGRQKSAYRNKRTAPKDVSSAALKPERRVTLLTKVSQHEVIISSFQKRSKPFGNRQVAELSCAPSFSENFMETPSGDAQCETAIAESSNADRVHEIDDIENGHAADASRSLSAQEMIPQQVTGTGSNNTLLASRDISCLQSMTETSVSESSATTISTLASQAHGGQVVCHQDTVATSCPGAACEVPVAPSPITSKVIEKKARPKCEAKHITFNVDGYIMNAAELPQVPTESAAFTEQANERVNREGTPSTTTVALLPHEHNQGSMLRLSNQNSVSKWRRKGFVTVARLGQEHFDSKAQEAVVDKKASSSPSPSDKTIAGADSLPDAIVGMKDMSQCNVSLSSFVPATLSSGETSATCKDRLDAAGSLNCADSESKVKKSKKVYKAISGNVNLETVAELSPVQILESSSNLAIKTLPFAEGGSLNLKSASCGFGKVWRPKLPGAGHGKAATKISSHQASKAATTIIISEAQQSKPCLTDIRKHRLEVSCDEECEDKSKQPRQDEGRDTVSLVVDRQQTAKKMSLTCVTGFDFNNLTGRKQKMDCNSGETLPLRHSRMEQRGKVEKLTGEQKLQQQEPLASKLEESNYTCRGDRPMNDDFFEPCTGRSSSSENHLGVDHEVSKAAQPSNLSSTTQGSQSVSSLQTQAMEDSLGPSQKSVSQPMLATQISKSKGLTREVNQSSNAALGLRHLSSVHNYQEQNQLPAKQVPQRHAGTGHIMQKYQHAGSVARSLPNFGRDSMKQGRYVSSWGGRQRDFPLDISRYEWFAQNHGHPQEGQSMHRWQQQKVWNSKVMRAQEQQMASTTCSSVSKPCECTVSEGKPGTENKQHIGFLQGASRVLWKPKQMSSVQASKEKCNEGGKDNLSSSASQKKRAQGECLLIESSGNAPLSSPCGDEQQLKNQASQKISPQMKETSEGCSVADYSSAPSSPICGSRQQVDNMGKQGLMKAASQSKKAFDELPAVILSSSCGSEHLISDIDEKETLKPVSLTKMGPEEHLIVTSSSCATLSTRGNGQQTGNTGKQSYKAVLEMEHSAVIKKVTSSVEQTVFGSVSQPVSAVSISLKLEETPLTRTKKPYRYYTSWRPKTVSGNIAVKSAFSKEVNENDPSASTHVEGELEKHTKPLPTSKFPASNDLHVWKNNGRHPVRASYGLPYRRKDFPHLQNSRGHQAKLHTDGASFPEHLDRANGTSFDQESSRSSKSLVTKEMKHASPMKQTEVSPREYPVSKLKFSQHHVYAVKQAHFTSNQHSTVGNRRPFSTKSNFPHDDNKKIVHYQQPLSHMCLPMEQGYRRPFSAKSNFSYDDNKRTVYHHQLLSHKSKHIEQVKVRENSHAPGVGHVESLSPRRSDIKPARHGQLHNCRKFADSEKRGWVVKRETRCGDR